METENNSLVYNGNFADTDIADSWEIRNGLSKLGWHYHNHGGRDEDIFFRFDRMKPEDTDSGTLREESSERISPYIISPPISLTAGSCYELNYEIRLFGTNIPGKTRLIMLESENGNAPDISNAVTLVGKEWPLDGFQWPVDSIRFKVRKSGEYRFAFMVENEVPVNLYWMVLFPFFDGLIPEGWLLDIAEQSWKISARDRFS